MTDKAMADKIYIEPLTLDVCKRIIEIENPTPSFPPWRPDGLTLSMELAKCGF